MAGPAEEVVRDMQEQAKAGGGTLAELKVSRNMYEQLEAECSPISPSDYFGIPITVLVEH